MNLTTKYYITLTKRSNGFLIAKKCEKKLKETEKSEKNSCRRSHAELYLGCFVIIPFPERTT